MIDNTTVYVTSSVASYF